MKQFFIGLICFLIVAGLGVSIYFNIDAINAKASLYTKEQMDEAVEKAYAEGNAKEQQYKQQIATLQNTLELAENELAEAAAMEVYLPKQLSEAEVEEQLKGIIAEVGAVKPSDMGKVMGVATKRLAGLAEGRLISTLVKKLLA